MALSPLCVQAIQQPKWVFTNADRLHAERCLSLLGIADLFEVQLQNARRRGAHPWLAMIFQGALPIF